MYKQNKFLNKLTPIDFIRRLKDENKYLKGEIKEEKEKLENIIKTLNKELEEVKEDNRKLTNEVEHYIKTRENMYYTI
jgi:predicted  nucleic acid-binding Zn-ribbon protein